MGEELDAMLQAQRMYSMQYAMYLGKSMQYAMHMGQNAKNTENTYVGNVKMKRHDDGRRYGFINCPKGSEAFEMFKSGVYFDADTMGIGDFDSLRNGMQVSFSVYFDRQG